MKPYSADADFVDDLLTDLGRTTEEISTSLSTIIKSIGQVSCATNDGSESITNISQKLTSIIDKSNDILLQSENDKKRSDDLIGMMSKIKEKASGHDYFKIWKHRRKRRDI